MDLSNLKAAEGSVHSGNFRKGRGHGSGNGKTAGKGHKGQKARSGAPRVGFEGGQMPLYRRIPKRGFKCRNSKEIVGINLSALEKFEDGSVVSIETLLESGIVKNTRDGVKYISFKYRITAYAGNIGIHATRTRYDYYQYKDNEYKLSDILNAVYEESFFATIPLNFRYKNFR